MVEKLKLLLTMELLPLLLLSLALKGIKSLPRSLALEQKIMIKALHLLGPLIHHSN